MNPSVGRVASLMAVALLIAGCTSPSDLSEGRWTGTFAPTDPSGVPIDVEYDVRYESGLLSIRLTGLDAARDRPLIARNPRLQGDTLQFAVPEPGAPTLLECHLVREADNGFRGLCTDGRTPWAEATMRPPPG
jgi:hypothetical protein